jgi:galactose mutarotase-like enzyme
MTVPETARDWVRLEGGGLRAAVDPHGAQLRSFTDADGLELLWRGDPASWPDQALTLFPVIGPLTGGELRHGGERYPMPPHGFAHLRGFATVEQDTDRCVLELRDDDATRRQYPFAFTLRSTFALVNGALRNELAVDNPGDEPLPADVGFHPGFNWPLEPGRVKQDYTLTFAEEEPAPIRRGAGDPVALYEEPRPTPVEDRVLRLRDELFEDLAIVWDRLRSRSVTYGTAGGRGLRVDFPDSPNLGLWMIPGARYLCIEPWHGLPIPQGFDGPFEEKPGVAAVEPRSTRTWRLSVTPLHLTSEAA